MTSNKLEFDEHETLLLEPVFANDEDCAGWLDREA